MRLRFRLLILASAVFLGAYGAIAQTKLNLEQAHILRELIKDSRIETVILPSEVAVGDTVPEGTKATAMPPEIAAKLPNIKSHFLILSAQQIIVLDPQREKIAEIIDR
jgi:hypothetical protein